MTSRISDKIGVCVAGHDGKIIFQNKVCVSLCPVTKGTVCHLFSNDSHLSSHLSKEQLANIDITEGMIFRKCQIIMNTLVDVVTINDGSTLTTMLYPLTNHIQKLHVLLKEYDLSKRELEVAYLMLDGRSNEAIAHELFISKATLKTHINRIYKKIPLDKIHILKVREQSNLI
jgi:DNA-binding CsgD family transcriptional regulator